MYDSLDYTMHIRIEDERLFINGSIISEHCYLPADVGAAVCEYYDNEQKGIDYVRIPLNRVKDYSEAIHVGEDCDRKKMLLDITLSLGKDKYYLADDWHYKTYPVILICRMSVCDLDETKSIGYQLGRAIERWLIDRNWKNIIDKKKDCLVEWQGHVGALTAHLITTPFTNEFRGRDSVEFNTGHEVRSEKEANAYFAECVRSGKKLEWWIGIDNS